MKIRLVASITLALALLASLPAFAQKKPQQQVKPIAGPRAAALRVSILYVAPDPSSEKVDRVQIGREMVVAEKSGPWLRVYANTDIEEVRGKDAPVFDTNDTPPPVSGWMEAKGVVIETTPNGDQILMGEAANQESLASDPRGPANAAKSARLLYRRLVEMFPNSPLVPEAAWRAADDLWQLQKADAASRSSAKERDPYMRDQMDEEELKKVIKYYPHTRQADLAAFELIDNKLCGDWQGLPKCPEMEAGLYEMYANRYPDSPKAAEALYNATYRQGVLVEMYMVQDDKKRSQQAAANAVGLAAELKLKYPQSDYAARAASIAYRVQQKIPVYGNDRD